MLSSRYIINKIVYLILISYIQLLDEKKIQQVDDLYKDFESPDAASKMYVNIIL